MKTTKLGIAVLMIVVAIAGCADLETTDTTFGGDDESVQSTDDSGSSTTGSSTSDDGSTASGPEMKFLGDTYAYYDGIGYYHVVGEVENQGGQNAVFVKISATFYNADGSVFDTTFTFSKREVVPVDTKSPFEVLVEDENAEIADYKLSVSASSTNKKPTGTDVLVIQGDSANWDSIGYHHVVGEVVNEGSAKANFVEVIASLYDSAGQITRTSFTFTEPEDINAGDSAGFDVLTNADGEDIASYTLWVEASGMG